MRRFALFASAFLVGGALLWVALGDEAAVPAATNAPAQQDPRRVAPPGIGVQQGGVGASFSQQGPMQITRWRELAQPDGSVRKQESYVLHAQDSRPIGDGLQQLEGVALQIFDHGEHVATMQAREAFVELSRDSAGRLSVAEQKAVQLREMVLTGEQGGRLAGLRLELGEARLEIGENDLAMATPPDDPVLLVIGGERPATLRGSGAKARLPRDRTSPNQLAEVHILTDPRLDSDGFRGRARGELSYTEDLATGVGRIVLADDVQLELTRAVTGLPGFGANRDARGDADDGATARGDHMIGWLTRSRDAGRAGRSSGDAAGDRRRGSDAQGLTWQTLLLTGAPATVEASGAAIEAPRLRVLMGSTGEPFLVSAHGGPSRFTQRGTRAGQREPTALMGTAEQRIHFVRPGNGPGAIHRHFGFPRWVLRPLDQLPIVVMAGRSRLEGDQQQVSASNGLRIVRPLAGDQVTMLGFGAVEIVRRDERPGQPALVATGTDGLRLLAGPAEERLFLGPPPARGTGPAATRFLGHRYQLRRGDVALDGAGACRIDRREPRIELLLEAPHDEIRGSLGAASGELDHVRTLRAVLDGQEVVELEAEGLPARATLVRADQHLEIRSPRIERIGPRSLRLLPVDESLPPWTELAEDDRLPRIRHRATPSGDRGAALAEVSGPRIDLHHAGGRDLVVDATSVDGLPPRITAELPQTGDREPSALTCRADRVRLMPFLVPPAGRQMHLAGRRGPLADVMLRSVARPWLLLDDVHEFTLDDATHGQIEGRAQRILVATGAGAALFLGDPHGPLPAEVRRTSSTGTMLVQGARIRVLRDAGVRLTAFGSFVDRSLFIAPTLTLHEPRSGGLLSHMRAICRGNIEVLPEEVVFDGPIRAAGLRPDGSDDPDGIRVDAGELTLLRRPDTGELTHALGREVTLDWSRLWARSAELVLDVERQRCVVRDPEGATVELPDGRAVWSPWIEVDYRTWAVSRGRGRVAQTGSRPEGPR